MTPEPNFLDLLEEDEREFAGQLGSAGTRTDTEVRLDWLLEKIAKRHGMVARNNAVADARVSMIEDWRRAENDRLLRGIAWLESNVRELLPQGADEFEREYGKRSRNLPYGTVGWRRHPDKVEVFDEARALAWAKASGLEIATKESVSKTTLKNSLEAGDEPDGFEIIRGLDEFYVKPDVLATKGE